MNRYHVFNEEKTSHMLYDMRMHNAHGPSNTCMLICDIFSSLQVSSTVSSTVSTKKCKNLGPRRNTLFLH